MAITADDLNKYSAKITGSVRNLAETKLLHTLYSRTVRTKADRITFPVIKRDQDAKVGDPNKPCDTYLGTAAETTTTLDVNTPISFGLPFCTLSDMAYDWDKTKARRNEVEKAMMSRMNKFAIEKFQSTGTTVATALPITTDDEVLDIIDMADDLAESTAVFEEGRGIMKMTKGTASEESFIAAGKDLWNAVKKAKRNKSFGVTMNWFDGKSKDSREAIKVNDTIVINYKNILADNKAVLGAVNSPVFGYFMEETHASIDPVTSTYTGGGVQGEIASANMKLNKKTVISMKSLVGAGVPEEFKGLVKAITVG